MARRFLPAPLFPMRCVGEHDPGRPVFGFDTGRRAGRPYELEELRHAVEHLDEVPIVGQLGQLLVNQAGVEGVEQELVPAAAQADGIRLLGIGGWRSGMSLQPDAEILDERRISGRQGFEASVRGIDGHRQTL